MKTGAKKQFFLQQTALFMTFLILTLPFFSAQAYALSITSVTITGSDGIEDVMSAENDYFIATVETSEEVDEDQLQISYTKEEAFDECSGETCTYISSQTDRSGQEMAYTIQLINNSIVVDEVEGTILVDEEEPEIEEYTVEKEGDDITISYQVTDTACDDCSGCGGIDYISLLEDDTEIQQINIASACETEDELETTVSELNLEDGDHELCLVAVDNVGQESDEMCEAVSVDSEGPHFETNSLVMTESVTRNDVLYVGADAILVDISINVSDSSLNENTVAGDFSDLNAVIGDTYANVTAENCEESDDDETLFTCSWYSIYVEDVSGTIKLPLYAQDNEGNEGTYSPTVTLTKDDSAPSIVQVYNDVGSEDLYLKSGTNSVYADFDPTGSAMSYGNAYLTFGLGSLSDEEATACWENGSYWTCVWNFSMSYTGTASSSLVFDAEDDAGNAMESYDVDVETDSTEPEITSISTSLDCPTGSDTLEVIINATDDADNLYASFYGEDVRTTSDPVEEECTDLGDGSFTCILYITDFVSYPEEEDVEIEVFDDAGNIGDDELSLSVCELEESGTPSLVTIYVDDNDIGALDKLTLSYIDYPLYVPLTFSMPSSANIVSKTATCDNGEGIYFIDVSDASSFMVVTLPSQSVPNATMSLNIDCSISMTMQYGDSVYSTPEVDEIEISVDLYGTPLGSIDDAIQQRIDLQKAGIAAAQAEIDTAVTWNTILGWFCKINEMITKANAVMSWVRTAGSIVAAAGKAIEKFPITSAIGAGMFQIGAALNSIGDYFYSIVVQFFWPPGPFGGIIAQNSGSGLGAIGAIFKTGCIIYSGKLCEGFNFIENDLIIRADEYGTPAYYEQSLGGEESRLFGLVSLPSESKAGGAWTLLYDWDPYKSIHTARNCLYIDATIYNLRKERQINCMYTRCLEDNAKNGLPTDICDVQFKERQCLYVDGAAWNAVGSPDVIHFFQLILNTFISNLDVLLLSIGYYAGCGWFDYYLRVDPAAFTANYEAGDSGLGWMFFDSACHVAATTLTMVETSWFTDGMSFDFEANLEGTDYCVGYE